MVLLGKAAVTSVFIDLEDEGTYRLGTINRIDWKKAEKCIINLYLFLLSMKLNQPHTEWKPFIDDREKKTEYIL